MVNGLLTPLEVEGEERLKTMINFDNLIIAAGLLAFIPWRPLSGRWNWYQNACWPMGGNHLWKIKGPCLRCSSQMMWFIADSPDGASVWQEIQPDEVSYRHEDGIYGRWRAKKPAEPQRYDAVLVY